MSLRKHLARIPSKIRDESGASSHYITADVLSKIKHAYTIWDEEHGHHWFLVDVGPPTGQRTFYVLSDAQDRTTALDPGSIWSAMADASQQGHFSIHVSKGSWAPCKLFNRFEGPNLVMSGLSCLIVHILAAMVHIRMWHGIIEPVVEEDSLHFVRNILDDRGLELVKMGGEYYVHKYAVKRDLLVVLQCEVENYKRLEQSPFVLHISHAVRSNSPEFGKNCVKGFLLPFTGKALASADWNWTIEDKESLMLDVLDAVHDFDVRGVVHTDLKCANILLTVDGLKLIDLDFLGSTSPWSSPFEDDSRQAAVHTFGKTIWELFTEQVPHGVAMNEAEVEGSLPTYVTDLIHDCCVDHKYKCVKQLYDATEQILDPIRTRRIPTAKLIASQVVDKGGT